jgi:hypothetical protein
LGAGRKLTSTSTTNDTFHGIKLEGNDKCIDDFCKKT